ncbi:unnamed protein product, partial [Owenia fusiformis]
QTETSLFLLYHILPYSIRRRAAVMRTLIFVDSVQWVAFGGQSLVFGVCNKWQVVISCMLMPSFKIVVLGYSFEIPKRKAHYAYMYHSSHAQILPSPKEGYLP